MAGADAWLINGQCAQRSAQLPDVEYRLVRVIGSVLGVSWSQLNLNVQTGSPPFHARSRLGCLYRFIGQGLASPGSLDQNDCLTRVPIGYIVNLD